jgi:isopenicillin-N N-acyltransferase like protein
VARALTVAARHICQEMILNVYMPALKRNWPRGWRELQGMAEGCDMDIKYLVMLNVRDDLLAARYPQSQAVAESTSAFFSHRATDDYVPILGHSWTAPKLLYDENLVVCLEIHYPRAEEVLTSIFLVTEAGMISGCGMNSDGLAVAGNRLLSREDAAPILYSEFPVTLLERVALEQISLDGAREDCEKHVRHASKHLLMATTAGFSTSLELSPPDLAFVYNGAMGSKTKLHTNRFQSFEAFKCRRLVKDRYRGQSSLARAQRLSALIFEQGGKGVSGEQIQGMFSDHEGNDEGRICHHGEDDQGNSETNMTVAFVMFDTNRRVVSICKGPPCKGSMVHFAFGEDNSVHADADVIVSLEDTEMAGTDDGSGDTEASSVSDNASLWFAATGRRPPKDDLRAPRNVYTGIAAPCPSPTNSPPRHAVVQALKEGAAVDHMIGTSFSARSARSGSPVSILSEPAVDHTASAVRDTAGEVSRVMDEMKSSSEAGDPAASPKPADFPNLDPALFKGAEDVKDKPARGRRGEKRAFYDPVRDSVRESSGEDKTIKRVCK